MPADWYAESLRVTFFVANDWKQEPLFAAISGVPPQEAIERVPTQLRQETGGVAGAHLTVVQQVGRIDVVLSSVPTNPSVPNENPFSWIGKFVDALAILDGLTDKAAAAVSSALRVAFAPILLSPTATLEEANASLSLLLPFVSFDPANDTDIVWQINRRRRTESWGLINRLARWEALQVQVGYIGLNQGAMPSAVPLSAAATGCAVRLALDINTDPANVTPITGTAVKETIIELRSHAVEIAERGDLA
jgi:hypothetical protein